METAVYPAMEASVPSTESRFSGSTSGPIQKDTPWTQLQQQQQQQQQHQAHHQPEQILQQTTTLRTATERGPAPAPSPSRDTSSSPPPQQLETPIAAQGSTVDQPDSPEALETTPSFQDSGSGLIPQSEHESQVVPSSSTVSPSATVAPYLLQALSPMKLDTMSNNNSATNSPPAGSNGDPKSNSSSPAPSSSGSPTTRQLIVSNGDNTSTATILLTSSPPSGGSPDAKYTLDTNNFHLVKSEPMDPMPPLASPALMEVADPNQQQQLYFISAGGEIVQSQLKGSGHLDQGGIELKSLNQDVTDLSHLSHVDKNGNRTTQLLVTNGDSTNTILVSTNDAKEYLTHGLNSSEIFTIKAEPMDPMPPLASPAPGMDGIHPTILQAVTSADKGNMRDLDHSPPATVISLAPAQPYPRGTTQLTFATQPYELSSNGQYTVQVNTVNSPPQYATVTQSPASQSGAPQTVYLTTDYITYRDYYPNQQNGQTVTVAQATLPTTPTSDPYQAVRQQLANSSAMYTSTAASSSDSDGGSTSFLDRYLRQGTVTTAGNGQTAQIQYKTNSNGIHSGLTVDLPSPDSGIGEATVTPRGENGAMTQAGTILPVSAGNTIDQNQIPQVGPATPGSSGSNSNASTPSASNSTTKSGGRRSWHEYGRNSEVDKVQIPKLFSDVGFKYFLESPISTSQRREDDRITYINKGQFYGITLEYIPDPDRPLKSATVKTLMLLVFREEKSHEDEIKAWQFWHSRQHSIKQRILDADTKNSSGIIGPIEEVTHNSISFYWNPLEGPAKINIAVQCLSTDFSNQKGVKGLPLHLQIDTFDDIREGAIPINRGYGQVKVFCDKGAERKTRDEERRAAKRKLSATGNGRKKIEDMYHATTERSEFYTMADVMKPPVLFTPSEELEKQINAGEINFYTGQAGSELSATGFEAQTGISNITNQTPSAIVGIEKRERAMDPLINTPVEMAVTQPPIKRMKMYPQDRVLIYAKQENEEVFHPFHLVPPSLVGLAVAIQNKYKLEAKNIRHIFKRCMKGITVQMDDDMVKHYSNEDTCLLEVHQVDEHTHDITLVEFDPN